jgi:hypothetical protein
MPNIPYIFFRPGTSIAPPYPALLRTYKVQQECLDYEGELVFQTGSRPLKDISVEEAKKNIVGFTAGCDFSPRPGKVLGRMNYIFSKAFDNFTPAGPVLVHPRVVGELPEVDLTTKWNGKIVQSDNSRNMIFNVAQILSSMSTGKFAVSHNSAILFGADLNRQELLCNLVPLSSPALVVEELGSLVRVRLVLVSMTAMKLRWRSRRSGRFAHTHVSTNRKF